MEIKTHVLTNPQHLDDTRKSTARKNIGAVGRIRVSSETHVAPGPGTDVADISNFTVPAPDSFGKILKSTGPGEYGWAEPAGVEQQQVDWLQADTTKVDYIKNRPSVFTGATEFDDGVYGLVPAPTSTEREYFLCASGEWSPIPAAVEVIDEVTPNSMFAVTSHAVALAIGDLTGFQVVNGTGADNHPDVETPNTRTIYLVKIDGLSVEDKYKEWIYSVPGQGEPSWECIGSTGVDSWKQWSMLHGSSGSDSSVFIGEDNALPRALSYALGIGNTAVSTDDTDYSGTDVLLLGSGNTATNAAYAYQLGHSNTVTGNSLYHVTEQQPDYPLAAVNIGTRNAVSAEGINIGKLNTAGNFGISIGEGVDSADAGIAIGRSFRNQNVPNEKTYAAGSSVAIGNNAFAEGSAVSISCVSGLNDVSPRAGGMYNLARNSSVAIGAVNSAYGESVTLGYGNLATGKSLAVGYGNTVNHASFIFGADNASTHSGMAIGYRNNTAEVVEGMGSSFALGVGNTALQYGFAVGRNNSLNNVPTRCTNTLTYAFGERNTIYGMGVLVGLDNRIGDAATANGVTQVTEVASAYGFGAMNTLNGASVAVGYMNTTAAGTFVFGEHNSAESGTVICGCSNYGAEESMVFGLKNLVCNQGVTIGYNNTVGLFSDRQAHTQSPDNTAWGTALGHNNTIEYGGYNVALGMGNVAGTESVAIGTGNTAFGHSWIMGVNNSAGNASSNRFGGHAAIIGSGNVSTSTLERVSKSMSAYGNYTTPYNMPDDMYTACQNWIYRQFYGSEYSYDSEHEHIDRYITDTRQVCDILAEYSPKKVLDEVRAKLDELAGLPDIDENTYTFSYYYEIQSMMYYPYIQPIWKFQPGDQYMDVADNTPTASLIVGCGNESGHYNSILVGAHNTSMATPGATEITDDDGFVLALGYRNKVERNYDIAIGYMSEARGGENIAITNSRATGYRNLSYNHSAVTGVCNVALNESTLYTRVGSGYSSYEASYICYNELYHSDVSYNPADNSYYNAFTENLFRNVTAYITASMAGATGNVVFNNRDTRETDTNVDLSGVCVSENFLVDVGTRKSGGLATAGFTVHTINAPDTHYNVIENNCVFYTNAYVDKVQSFYNNFAVMSEFAIQLNSPETYDDSSVSNNVLLNGKVIGSDSVKHGPVTFNLVGLNSTLDITGCTRADSSSSVVRNNVLLGTSYLLAANPRPAWQGSAHCAVSNFLFDTQASGTQETVGFCRGDLRNTLHVFNFGKNTVWSTFNTAVYGVNNAVVGAVQSFVSGAGNGLYRPYTAVANGPDDVMFSEAHCFGNNNYIYNMYRNHTGVYPTVCRTYMLGDNNRLNACNAYDNRVFGSGNRIGYESPDRVAYATLVNLSVTRATRFLLTEPATVQGVNTDCVIKYTDGTISPVDPEMCHSTGNTLVGSNNMVSPGVCWGTAVGNGNEIHNQLAYSTSGSFVQGNNNYSVDGSNSIVMGNGNTASGHNSVAIGCQLVADQWQTVVGKYNEGKDGPSRVIPGFSEVTEYKAGDTVFHETRYYRYTALAPSTGAWDDSKWAETDPDSDKALFIVGNGYAETDGPNWQNEQYIHRSNAMEVYADGTVRAHDFVSDNELDLDGRDGISVTEDLVNAKIVITLDSATASVIDFLKNRPAQGTYGIQCTNGALSWVAIGTTV